MPKKDRSSSRRYAEAKTNILKAIRSKEYWPDGMKHPREYRKFYMADDFSHCGFTRESQISKLIAAKQPPK